MTQIAASIVVPTYKECANLHELVTRVFAALGPARAAITEIIVVDDNSADGSEDVINKLAASGMNVRIIVRTTERGLSSAVLRGFKEARGKLLLCMDADLQHPPESVPALIDAIDPALGKAEFVIGTRYGGAGFSVDKDWPLHRQLASSGARMLARPLSALSDPMTGFFGLPTEVLARAKAGDINPIGFKIALELFVKCRVVRHAEVPINFGVRVHGESKLTGKVIIQYLRHLYDLYDFAYPSLPWIIFLIFLTLALLFLL
ncbi:hypothetical protein ACHHYP_07743 [Achlya hypogyna]|uniref:Dolichol-phosphate mannosyltransferase subunit 1 n=1 Tax=Achlya hypogyna TaxID=1202772 RepID=A0A1V9ZLM0_ACHHY|nr:hypothetical protein ACHHYP_07743 [Achlya hypogyna]